MDEQSKITDKINGTGLVLSIFLAVTLAQGLTFFLAFPNIFSWLAPSFILSAIIIVLIYFISDIKVQNWGREISKMFVIVIISLLPFALQRLTMSFEDEVNWDLRMFLIYLSFLFISMIVWGICEIFCKPKNKSKGKIIITISIVLILIIILAIALIKAGVFRW